MIKVKEFVERAATSICEGIPVDIQINDFLKNKKVTLIDIKYQIFSNGNGSYSDALLIYKEDK